jgi:hypothetical protein
MHRDDDLDPLWDDGVDWDAVDDSVDAEAAAESLRNAVAGNEPMYHITWQKRLSRIQRDGLLVGGSVQGNRWMGGAATRARCHGRIFLTCADRIDYWSTQMAENLTPPARGGTLVLLEIDATGLELSLDHEYPGDYIMSQAIPASRIRGILHDDPWLTNVDAWLAARREDRDRMTREVSECTGQGSASPTRVDERVRTPASAKPNTSRRR